MIESAGDTLKLAKEQLDLAKKLHREEVLPHFEVIQAELHKSKASHALSSEQNRYRTEMSSFLDLIELDSSRKDISLAPIRIAVSRFKNGISNGIELDESLKSFNRSKINKINATYRLQITIAQLEQAVGKDFFPSLENSITPEGNENK